MGHKDGDKARWVWPRIAAAGMAAAGIALLTLPALAQHAAGGGHAGAARSFTPSRSMGAPMRSSPGARSALRGSAGAPRISPNNRVRPNGGPRYRRPGNYRSRRRPVYGVGFVGVPNYGFPYYGDPSTFFNGDSDDEDAQAAQAQPDSQGQPDYGPAGPPPEEPYGDEGYPPPRPPYASEAYAQGNQNPAPTTDGLDHPALTLVFNDGRPPEKVNDYVLTGSSVFVAENGHQRVIPVADLNLPATIQQNREAGVDFELPGAAR
jgi:hypothetical protein